MSTTHTPTSDIRSLAEHQSRADRLAALDWPVGFLWGSATAAAQVEGAGHDGGKEDSIWDVFARVPGAVANGDTPETAVDHYHRMPADVQLMKELGLGAYRFSVSWSRVAPGDGAVNSRGLDFYSRLVDELLDAGILPWLTLYHWDLPQAVEDTGGWTNRDTAQRFRDYSEVVYQSLGDRVQHWTTFNEPFCSTLLSYGAGIHAPGVISPRAALAAVHHTHLAHGLGVSALRQLGAHNLGITLNLSNAVPHNPEDEGDLDAARRFDALQNRLFLDPLLRGEYPQDLLEDVVGLGLDELIVDGDLELISLPLDFLGVNYYHDDNVSAYPLPPGAVEVPQTTTRAVGSPWVGSEFITFPSRGLPRTAMGWEVNPDGLRSLLTRLGMEYDTLPPLYVTENGAAADDVVAHGRVHDLERTQYLLDHIEKVADAISQGADVRGYFVWSLLDNYEWERGYDKRFGIVHVDYMSQERLVKDSGMVYSRLIGGNAAHTLA
ncbi:beta-glucosidase [Rathayibacter toxicus]|uniref:GH1 family beta-glucosidase n=1 Tax=Rathayibacter toxicus TaxID=145458 RepID=UPI0009E25622|nr:GH1 family beta-glucosidase [Rathayibacter toxicus]PPG23079.1 beta-glucosidase [Rathayibacter toxicus]PPG47662.1 beta-glucosidase [Rathayibacter toxicus]PPH64535.1 beta-glucosidase [Rathayibacter toxicus]PPH68727.1 beta-glucosidase [Rathayibacter toxicus]PPH73581.1 beta-glucosidase [Rathayibacter toxicus]